MIHAGFLKSLGNGNIEKSKTAMYLFPNNRYIDVVFRNLRKFLGLKRLFLAADEMFLQDGLRALSKKRTQKERGWIISKIVETYPRNAQIFDIGCGGGFLLHSIRRFVMPTCELHGIDISIPLIRFAKKHTNACFIVADAHKLPFKQGIFDICVACNLLHHLVNVKYAVDEMMRILKTSGYFVIIEQGVSSKITSVFAYVYTRILEKLTGEPFGARFLTPKEIRLLFPHTKEIHTVEYFSKAFFRFKFTRIFFVARK